MSPHLQTSVFGTEAYYGSMTRTAAKRFHWRPVYTSHSFVQPLAMLLLQLVISFEMKRLLKLDVQHPIPETFRLDIGKCMCHPTHNSLFK